MQYTHYILELFLYVSSETIIVNKNPLYKKKSIVHLIITLINKVRTLPKPNQCQAYVGKWEGNINSFILCMSK